MIIIDGKKLSEAILAQIKSEVALLPFQPIFCDVLVGENAVSEQYVKMKAKRAENVGIKFHKASFPSTITTNELVSEINKLNNIENMCGIIVQLPLPESIDKKVILDTIKPELDVDALGSFTSEKFYNGEKGLALPTALACMAILDSLNIDLSQKNIIVLGQGELVGKPVAAMLKKRDFKVTTISSKTDNKEEIIKNADVIISGIGKGAYINGDMIKEGVVIVDAGTSESGAGIVGDVDIYSVQDKASHVSPVPGGVGPVTVAMLFKNVLEVAKAKNQQIG